MAAQCRLVYGSVLCTAGRWPEGEAALLMEVLGPKGTAYLAHYADAAVRLASLRLMQGRVEEAAELLGPFEDRPDACEPLGRLHLLAGELDLAEAVARRGLDGIRHDVLHAGRLRSLLVEIELSRDNVDVAARHADALTELAERPSTGRCWRRLSWRGAGGRGAPGLRRCRLRLQAGAVAPSGDQRPLLSGIIALELAEVLLAAGGSRRSRRPRPSGGRHLRSAGRRPTCRPPRRPCSVRWGCAPVRWGAVPLLRSPDSLSVSSKYWSCCGAG